jgi:hypothetical protein
LQRAYRDDQMQVVLRSIAISQRLSLLHIHSSQRRMVYAALTTSCVHHLMNMVSLASRPRKSCHLFMR